MSNKTKLATSANWLSDDKINEITFCDELTTKLPMKFIDGEFYSIDGNIHENQIKQEMI